MIAVVTVLGLFSARIEAQSSGSGPPPSVLSSAYPPHAASTSAYPLEVDRGSPAVLQSLRKLHTRASLIMIVAHPDDEDGGMLTYQSRGQGVDTTLLTLNRESPTAKNL